MPTDRSRRLCDALDGPQEDHRKPYENLPERSERPNKFNPPRAGRSATGAAEARGVRHDVCQTWVHHVGQLAGRVVVGRQLLS